MKILNRILLLTLFLAVFAKVGAQETIYHNSLQSQVVVARDLFNQEKYNAAYIEFDKITNQLDKNSLLYAEANYYRAVAALNADYRYGDKLLQVFLDDFPESAYQNKATFNLARYDFKKKRYAKAIKTYRDVDTRQLADNENIERNYQLGVSYLMLDKTDKAASHFYKIKDSNNLYSRPASYYWAHIMYKQEKFERALSGFKKLENDPTYSKVIPIYVSHIYYKEKRYQDIINYTTPLIHLVNLNEQKELSKLVGDSYFHLKDYKNAVKYLEKTYRDKSSGTREESYALGYSYYKTEAFSKTAPLLTEASRGKDELAQNAYYALADTYIKLNNKEKAKTAFGAAADLDFNEKIKENALFNYAKLTYELSYSPFNETIKAFDKYISLYPNSQRNREAYEILSEVYMVTRNYKDAMSSIEEINPKTKKIKKAYQRVAFLRGVELFNNHNFNDAITNFDIAIENGIQDANVNAKALFWKAESLYQLKKYSQSIKFYEQFVRAANNLNIEEKQLANYNLGYAYFKTENYANAANYFQKFVYQNSADSYKTADAYNRMGDYAFLSTNYQKAGNFYNEAYRLSKKNGDYSLLQTANAQGLLQNQNKKIENLKKLLNNYPKSDYYDNALYELGRTYERMGENNSAENYYEKIVSKHPNSKYVRKALLQLGLINYNNQNTQKALSYYKKVAEKYPNSDEADVALMGIKNCHIDMNNVDQYFAYAKKLDKGRSVSTSEQDSITYQAAERLYLSNSPQAKQQLQRYLQQFRNGSFALNAHFYLAELQYKDAEYNKANTHYQYVVNQKDNIFTEEALSKASELIYSNKEYRKALQLFNRLEKISSSKWNDLKAAAGQMRSNLYLNQFGAAKNAAEKVLTSEVANEQLKKDANYTIGKSYLQMNNEAQALPYFQKIADNTQIEVGTEAKHQIAQIFYNQNKKQEAENEIMSFIEQGTPHQYWLAKSFLLLASIYEDRGEDFEAKHTLLSLYKNYDNDSDGIKNEASERIIEIENREKAKQQKAQDSSFQLKLIDN